MSVVCCKIKKDKIEIAADTIEVYDWTQKKSSSKLIKTNNMIIGMVGDCMEASRFMHYCTTNKPRLADTYSIMLFLSEFSEWMMNKFKVSDIENDYMLIFDKKAFRMLGGHVDEITDYYAIGAGMDYALSALYLGHGVKKAVKTACELSIYCEEPIEYYYIRK